MEKRFEVSFKNPVLRTWIIIFFPSFVIASVLLFLTNIPSPYITFTFTTGSWLIFFIWYIFYKNKNKRIMSDNESSS